MPTGLLLSNLGSPDAPRRREVARFLRQFLTDRRVVDIPWIPRQMLARGLIAPLRSSRSARAYRKIWTPEGSPLVVHSRALAGKISERLGLGWKVALGMRYGNPSLADALESLLAQGCSRIVLLPLYPQYASATTGSTLEEVWRVAARLEVVPQIVCAPPFFDHPGFLRVVSDRIRVQLESVPDAHVVFSYHGLPERQIRKADATGSCLTGDCCLGRDGCERGCYKAQCHATSRLLAAQLGLPDERWTVSFQSRLGRIPWIGPSTVDVVSALADRGEKRIVVATPAFVADCLETLEEIGMGLARSVDARGARLLLAQCPNAGDDWAGVVSEMASFLSSSGR